MQKLNKVSMRLDFDLDILVSTNRNFGVEDTCIPDTEIAFDWLDYHS